MTRREAREAVFGLLFETDFHIQDTPQGIYDVSCDNRDIGEDNYVRAAYFGVTEHMAHLDAIISTVSSATQSCVDVVVYSYYEFIYIYKRKPFIFIFMFLIALVIYLYL